MPRQGSGGWRRWESGGGSYGLCGGSCPMRNNPRQQIEVSLPPLLCLYSCATCAPTLPILHGLLSYLCFLLLLLSCAASTVVLIMLSTILHEAIFLFPLCDQGVVCAPMHTVLLHLLAEIEVFSWIRTSTPITLLESMGIRLELTGMKVHFDQNLMYIFPIRSHVKVVD